MRAQLVPPTPAVSRIVIPAESEPSARRLRDPAPDLLRDHRNRQCADHRLHLREEPGEVALPFGLDRLLERVQVEDERVGLDHVDDAAAVIDARTRS